MKIHSWGAWTALPYNTTNFQNVGGASDQDGQYRVSALSGDVELRGVCQTKTGITYTLTSTVIATLPAGARPTKTLQFPVYVYDNNGIGGTMSQLQIDSSGVMVILRDLTGRAQTRTSPYYVTIEGLRFSILA